MLNRDDVMKIWRLDDAKDLYVSDRSLYSTRVSDALSNFEQVK